MVLVVPFDGSPLSEAALIRAREFADAFEEPILAVTVVRIDNVEYARDRGWIDEGEFDSERISTAVRKQVHTICADARVRFEEVDRYAPSGTIANRIRTVARDVDASIVFIGSENAGELVSSIGSVGKTVAASDAYDVLIVRKATVDMQ